MYPFKDIVECCFEPCLGSPPFLPEIKAEVFLGITKEFCYNVKSYYHILSEKERKRADSFKFEEERATYIACHGLLRLVLAKKMRCNPYDVVFHYDANNKPWLVGDNYCFNISHTKNAFAFVISEFYYSGIDIENMEQQIDIDSISEIAFSEREKRALQEKNNRRDNFFRIWTRKEALLKAIGVGIIDELYGIETVQKENIIKKELISDKIIMPVIDRNFIYSEKILDFFISVALPGEGEIKLVIIDKIKKMEI